MEQGGLITVPGDIPFEGLNLTEVMAGEIGSRDKAFPFSAKPLTIEQVGAQGWNSLRYPFLTPVMVLKESAVSDNLALMARYCQSHGVSLAPHAKTPLSPQLAERQLRAGAWGLTVANVSQARVLQQAGAKRLLVANEVVDSASARWIAEAMNLDLQLELYCLVDSTAGVELLTKHLIAGKAHRRLPVLIEIGIPGARCGCRTLEQALDVAAAVRASPSLQLCGVEVYENLFVSESPDDTRRQIDDLLGLVRRITTVLDERSAFQSCQEIIVTGGGSMWFDRVVELLGGAWNLSRPVRTVIRPGCYVTHDFVNYERLSPMAERNIGQGRLRQGLELWSRVLSLPEPGLAILDFGKRDAASDRGSPIPFMMMSNSIFTQLSQEDYEIAHLNDHHARLQVPSYSELQVGDLVGCYVSHPCTSFDKWPLIPVVDDKYNVLDAIRSLL